MRTAETSVAHRIDALLARVAGIRRGSECPRPVKFNAAGERHAREVARRDAKPVDTAMPLGVADRADPATPDVSSPAAASAEPVTGTSTRLRPRKGR